MFSKLQNQYNAIKKNWNDGVACRNLYINIPFCLLYILVCFPLLFFFYCKPTSSNAILLVATVVTVVPTVVIGELWVRCCKPRSEKIILFSLFVLVAYLILAHVGLFFESQQLHYVVFGFELHLEKFQLSIYNIFVLSIYTLYSYFSLVRSNLVVLNRNKFLSFARTINYAAQAGVIVAQFATNFPNNQEIEEHLHFALKIVAHFGLIVIYGPLCTDFLIAIFGGFRSKNQILPMVVFNREEGNAAPRISINIVQNDCSTVDDPEIA